MIASITKIEKKPSKFGGIFYYVFFRGIDKNNYYSCIYPAKRNYTRWSKVLRVGVTLKGLKLLRGRKRLIDADSRFKKLTEE